MQLCMSLSLTPISTSFCFCLTKVLQLQACATLPSFMWILETRTWVPVLYSPSCLPTPRPVFEFMKGTHFILDSLGWTPDLQHLICHIQLKWVLVSLSIPENALWMDSTSFLCPAKVASQLCAQASTLACWSSGIYPSDRRLSLTWMPRRCLLSGIRVKWAAL